MLSSPPTNMFTLSSGRRKVLSTIRLTHPSTRLVTTVPEKIPLFLLSKPVFV
jgi:hypothetical protein